jgi:hypothetical protein
MHYKYATILYLYSPFSIRSSTISKYPSWHARWIGVYPLLPFWSTSASWKSINILLKLHKYILLQRIGYNYTYNDIRLNLISLNLVTSNIFFGVFNATFNNISAISWKPVLLVEETGVPGENHWSVSHCQTLSHNVVSSTPCLSGVRTQNISGDS